MAIFAIHRPRTRVDSPRTNLIHLRQPARGIIFHRFVTLPRRKETVHLSWLGKKTFFGNLHIVSSLPQHHIASRARYIIFSFIISRVSRSYKVARALTHSSASVFSQSLHPRLLCRHFLQASRNTKQKKQERAINQTTMQKTLRRVCARVWWRICKTPAKEITTFRGHCVIYHLLSII